MYRVIQHAGRVLLAMAALAWAQAAPGDRATCIPPVADGGESAPSPANAQGHSRRFTYRH
jgi:hypothetical protein